MDATYANVILWATLAISAIAVIVLVAGWLLSLPAWSCGKRPCFPAIRDSVLMLLVAQVLTFFSLVLHANDVTPIWELPAALLLSVGASSALGRRMYAGRRGLASYWFGLRRAFWRYREIDRIGVGYTQDDHGNWLPQSVALSLCDGAERAVTGYQNLLSMARMCQDHGVAVDLEEVYRVARLRGAMWVLVLFVAMGFLLINGLWAAGIIEVQARLLEGPPII